MNPGPLDRKIQIQRQAPGLFLVTAQGEFILTSAGERILTGSAKDALGQEIDAWGLWHTRMARRIETSGRERTDNARRTNSGEVSFRIRATNGIKTSDRLVDTTDGQAYDIEDFIGDPRQGWMEIHCIRRRTPETANQIF